MWKLADASKTLDVIVKSCETLDEEKANCNIGHRGVAVFWKTSSSQYVRQVTGQSEPVC